MSRLKNISLNMALIAAFLFSVQAHAALPPLVLGNFTLSTPTVQKEKSIHIATSITAPANVGPGTITITLYDPKNVQKNFSIPYGPLTAGKPFPIAIDYTPSATDLDGGYSLSASAWSAPGYYGWLYNWAIFNVAENTNVSPIDSSYHLVFDDEFNGTSLDSSKWNVVSSSMGGNWSSDQFVPGNVTTGSGFLSLNVTRGSPSGRPYSAGFIVTKQSFTYGYWEVRAKMPSGHGMWPAFWMNANGSYPEIDMFEWLGNTPNQQWMTYHPVNDATLTDGAGLGTTVNKVDYSTSYHVYGMMWLPKSITWYIDGLPVFQLTEGQIYNGAKVDITNVAMQTILNNSVGGWNNNTVDSQTLFPGKFLVDYVHIYSNDPKMPAINPQAGYGGPGDSTGSGNL